MKPLFLFPAAEKDLEDIWLYSAETWSVSQAESYHASLVEAFRDLASARKKGRPTGVRPGILKYPVGSHFIYFRDDESRIAVVRVLHKRQDVEANL